MGKGKKKGDPFTNGPTCGAKAKSTGVPCKLPAGYGTPHRGEGRCKIHGGIFKVTKGTHTKLQDPQNILNCMDHGLEQAPAIDQIYEKDNIKHIKNATIQTELNRSRLLTTAIEIGLMTKPGPDGELEKLTMIELLRQIQQNPKAVQLLQGLTETNGRLEEKAARIRAIDATFTAEDVAKMAQNFSRAIAKYVPEKHQKALMAELRTITAGAEKAMESRIPLVANGGD